jgi:heme/copper-type cytochrome/quinol oxidase subunit 3
MGDVLPLRSEQSEADLTARIGMTIFLTGWVMAFASLFLVLGYLRVRAPVWPPAGAPALPIVPAAINTAILLASSVALVYAASRIRRNDNVGLIKGLVGAIALGGAFLFVQVWAWMGVSAAGLAPATHGVFASTYYALTAFHAAHVIAGLIVLVWVLRGAAERRFDNAMHTPVLTSAMFWHFVDGMWVITFATLYVL